MNGSGARDRWVTIQQMQASSGSSKFPVETWTDLSRVWMRREEVRQETTKEEFGAHQLSAPFETRWDAPYSADWDPDLIDVSKVRRLVSEGRTYDIRHAEHLDRKRGVAFITLARQG